MAGKSDLGVRTASAVVMVAIAVGAFLLGSWAVRGLVVIACLAMLWEWQSLVTKMPHRGLAQLLWRIAGVAYIGLAGWLLWQEPLMVVILPIVWAIDIFAYFSGRTFGGPKIAPSISPSKTWAGLIGGIIGASIAVYPFALALGTSEDGGPWYDINWLDHTTPTPGLMALSLFLGVIAAVLAQSGDFFESWMKRKAGVKDSSRLIPGHGGVFDRLDGALPLIILVGLTMLAMMS